MVAILFSRGSSRPRDQTCVSCDFCIADRFFTAELPGKPQNTPLPCLLGQCSRGFPPNSLPASSLSFFFFQDFSSCGPFLNSLLNLLQYCFCFTFWFFGHQACGILASQPGVEPVSPALEGKLLTLVCQGSLFSVSFEDSFLRTSLYMLKVLKAQS